MSRISYGDARQVHTGLPILGFFGLLRDLDDSEDARAARAAERARRAASRAAFALAEARARPTPKFRIRIIDSLGDKREEEIEPGAEVLGVALPPGLRTMEAIAEELRVHLHSFHIEIKDGVLEIEGIPF